MSVDLLLWFLADAGMAARMRRCAFLSDTAFAVAAAHEWAEEMERERTRIGAWRMTWWRAP